MAIEPHDRENVEFDRSRLLFMSRVRLELFDKYYDGIESDAFGFDIFQRALDGEFNDYWGVHLDEDEVKRFAREWREENLYQRILARDASAFEGYSLDFAVWLDALLQKVVIYADTGYFRFAAFDNELKNKVLAWSGWERDGVSWTED